MTWLLDQQFVAHVFAAIEGPDAAAAYRSVSEIWRGCGHLYGMSEPIRGAGLPPVLPPSLAELSARAGTLGPGGPDGELAVAGIESPGPNGQAILRLHHDVLCLSVALVPPEAARPDGAQGRWWRDFDFQWNLLTAPHMRGLLGEARLYLARVDAEAEIRAADPGLYTRLSGLLPDVSPDGGTAGVSWPAGFAVWEAVASPADRAGRRVLIAIAPGADPAASAMAWSRGDTAIPPLARYLLHAAKLRYELRVWQRDSEARQLRESLDGLGAELRRPGTTDPAKAELLRQRRLDAAFLQADLSAMRRTAEIAADNLGRALDLDGLALPGSMFADDAALARSLLERLDDEIGYLAIAAGKAEQTASLVQSAPVSLPAAGPKPAPGPAPVRPGAGGGNDPRHNVFVVYGRDEAARRALFDFLRALGLRPLEWEMLIRQMGEVAPFLSETVQRGLDLATAVVVLMTPEDVVHLHPELHDPDEAAGETADTLQARPNVLIELGMALAAKPGQTLVLMAGQHRVISDLGGHSYIQLADTPDCRRRIALRLETMGCLIDDTAHDWLHSGDFGGLAALRRVP